VRTPDRRKAGTICKPHKKKANRTPQGGGQAKEKQTLKKTIAMSGLDLTLPELSAEKERQTYSRESQSEQGKKMVQKRKGAANLRVHKKSRGKKERAEERTTKTQKSGNFFLKRREKGETRRRTTEGS